MSEDNQSSLARDSVPVKERQTGGGGLEQLLRRYIGVWIWSVLVGLNTGVTLAFSNYREYSQWGVLAVFVLLPALVAMLAAIGAWIELAKGFRLLVRELTATPGIQEHKGPKPLKSSGDVQLALARSWVRSFLLIVYAIAMLLSSVVFEALVAAVRAR